MLWRCSEFFLKSLQEGSSAHARIPYQPLGIAVHFRVIVLYEIAETDVGADKRSEEIRHL